MSTVKKPRLLGVSKRKGPRSRRWVLKRIFERRHAELTALRDMNWPLTQSETNTYGRAIVLYTEARDAWRRIRGWK